MRGEEARAEETQAEEVLHGGNTSVVVRVGDTVRRQTGLWTPAVHALLAHLKSVGFGDAPTVLGSDDQGREVLRHVEGEVGLLAPGQPLPRRHTLGRDAPPVAAGNANVAQSRAERIEPLADVSAPP